MHGWNHQRCAKINGNPAGAYIPGFGQTDTAGLKQPPASACFHWIALAPCYDPGQAAGSSISIRFAWLLRMGPFRELQGLYIILFSFLNPGWAGKKVTRFF